MPQPVLVCPSPKSHWQATIVPVVVFVKSTTRPGSPTTWFSPGDPGDTATLRVRRARDAVEADVDGWLRRSGRGRGRSRRSGRGRGRRRGRRGRGRRRRGRDRSAAPTGHRDAVDGAAADRELRAGREVDGLAREQVVEDRRDQREAAGQLDLGLAADRVRVRGGVRERRVRAAGSAGRTSRPRCPCSSARGTSRRCWRCRCPPNRPDGGPRSWPRSWRRC